MMMSVATMAPGVTALAGTRRGAWRAFRAAGAKVRGVEGRRAWAARCSSGEGAAAPGGGGRGVGDGAAGAEAGPWARVSEKVFGQAKLDRAKLASIGTSCLLSYGAISNLNAITLLIIAWVTFGKVEGLSPMAPGMWPKYLAAYGVLYATVGSLLRPARVALAISVTPFFDRIVDFFRGRFNVSKPVAFGMTVFCVNVCGSCSYLALGLLLATTVTGTPLFHLG